MECPFHSVSRWVSCAGAGAFSPATAMRALAAILTLAAWTCRLHAQTHVHLPRALLSEFGYTEQHPVSRLYACGRTLGPTKCLSTLSVWRAENAVEALQAGRETRSNLVDDLKEFPWEQYSNVSDDQVYSELCDGAERLLRYRSLSLNMIPGYTFELDSKGNGTLNVDILKSEDAATARGTSKLQKRFYNILPFLMVPGLIMAAILPFVLPALKLMTVAVVMLNNMALSGAVFTLLRNNAFSDHYEKKVIYVNDGYKNEQSNNHIYYKEIPLENAEIQYSASDMHGISDDQTAGEGFVVDDYPTNEQWINQYYGNDGSFAKNRRSSQRKKILVKHHY